MPYQSLEPYLKCLFTELFVIMIVDLSITGELHPQATCYMYVFWPRNIMLKLSSVSGLFVVSNFYGWPGAPSLPEPST